MVEYGPEVALIVVDIQNDFADPKGSLHVKGGEAVVPVANREVERGRWPPAHLSSTHRTGIRSRPRTSRKAAASGRSTASEPGVPSFIPALRIEGEVIRKGTGGEDGYCGLTVKDQKSGDQKATALGSRLHEKGIRRVVVLGLATDYCVGATAHNAAAGGWETTVLREGIRAVDMNPDDGERMLSDLVATGVHIDS